MTKYRVYGLWTASKYLGEVEADSAKEAEAMVMDGDELSDECSARLCHHCSRELDLGDMYKVEVEEVSLA